jgi:putative endonuclease
MDAMHALSCVGNSPPFSIRSMTAIRGSQPTNAEALTTWWLYLLACQDGRTYVGIALDPEARFRVHTSGKGSKFTRSNRPVRILVAQPFIGRSAAQKAEHALKRLARPARLSWALQWPLTGGQTSHALQCAADLDRFPTACQIRNDDLPPYVQKERP